MHSIRFFIWSLLDLMEEAQLSCDEVLGLASSGVGTELMSRYPRCFEKYGYFTGIGDIKFIDQLMIDSDTENIQNYCCESDEGIKLLIRILLDNLSE